MTKGACDGIIDLRKNAFLKGKNMRYDRTVELVGGRCLKLRYAREEVTPETYFDHLHSHRFFEICIPLSGEMLHMANGVQYMLRRGDVFFCRPGDEHFAFCREASVYERYAVWLPADAFSDVTPDALGFMKSEKLDSKNFFRILPERQEAFFSMLDGIGRLLKSDTRAGDLSVFGATAGLVSGIAAEADNCLGEYGGTSAGRVPPLVSRVILYVRENFGQPIGVAEIADNFNVNRDYLSRLFRVHTGTTLHGYLVFVRLRAAKDLLSAGAGVTETAFACGFNSTSYFIKVFSAETGVTPARFCESRGRAAFDKSKKS